MTLRPCVVCGEPTGRTRCPEHTPIRSRATAEQRGCDTAWRSLSRRARRLSPLCEDCGATENLSTDHSEEAWARKAAGKVIRLQDFTVLCGPCNTRRGPADPRGEGLTSRLRHPQVRQSFSHRPPDTPGKRMSVPSIPCACVGVLGDRSSSSMRVHVPGASVNRLPAPSRMTRCPEGLNAKEALSPYSIVGFGDGKWTRKQPFLEPAIRAGLKGQITMPPLSFKGWPADRAARRVRFVREFCRVPSGHAAGDPVRLRDFQTEIVAGAFAPGVRTALVSIPRANGKTALAAMLGLAELFVGPPSAETLVVATDQRQVDLTLKLARRMVELNPVLEERFHVFRDRLYLPENDATLLPLPAEPGALHGHDPSLLIVDELHVVTRDVWEAATTAAGKRAESLTLAIGTTSTSVDSIMWELVEHGRLADDPAFYFRGVRRPGRLRCRRP